MKSEEMKEEGKVFVKTWNDGSTCVRRRTQVQDGLQARHRHDPMRIRRVNETIV